MINLFQNKSFCLHIRVCTVYIYYVHVKTHIQHIFRFFFFLHVFACIYLHKLYLIYKRKIFLNIHMHVCVFIYT